VPSPERLEPMSRISVALTAKYLNVRQRKLGTIIILTFHILQLDSANTGSLPMEDFLEHNPNYFQITQPSSVTVTPPYREEATLYFFVSVLNPTANFLVYCAVGRRFR
jgi:hypothetical protein